MADILSEKWMKGVAITTTIFAVVASIAGSRSAFFVAKAQMLTAQEGSQWAYYQAKSIKQSLLETEQNNSQVQLQGSLTQEQRALLEKSLKQAGDTVVRYNQEKEDIKHAAEGTGKENALVVRRGSQFSVAVVFSQVAVMLSSVSALLKRRELWYVGLIMGAISLVFLANGLLLFF